MVKEIIKICGNCKYFLSQKRYHNLLGYCNNPKGEKYSKYCGLINNIHKPSSSCWEE